MRTRLDQGLWAFGQPDGLLLGRLDGGFSDGWDARFDRIPELALPEVARVLNVGGAWRDGTFSVQAAEGWSRLSFDDDERGIVLDEASSARLQILADLPHRRAGLPPGAWPARRVHSSRGVLRVTGEAIDGLPRAWSAVEAHAGGEVMVTVPTTTGISRLVLPALPLLVAAAEASRDQLSLALEVASTEKPQVSVVVHPPQAEQAAAEAQWLLAGFERHYGVQR